MNRQSMMLGRRITRRIYNRNFMIVILLLFQFILLGVSFVLLSQYIHYIYLINLIMSFILAVYIVNRQESPEFKIAWLTFMCLLPVFGIFYYLYFELNPKWKKNATKAEKLIKDTAYLLEGQDQSAIKAAHDIPDQVGFLNFLQKKGPFPVYAETDVTYYDLGEKGFEAIKTALRNAKSYIFMEYFIVSPGNLLVELIEILKERAEAGVEIRFMYDGFCHTRTLPADFPIRLRELGILVHVFEPLSPFLSTDQNYRDHRKITVVDGKVAFTGGFNLADEYVNYTHPYGHWKDVVVKLSGDAVKTFVILFLQNWHLNGEQKKDDWEAYIAADLVRPADSGRPEETNSSPGKGFIVPYADSPNTHNEIGETVYLDILNQAKKYVWITSPYLILGSVVLKAITYAAERGVDVRIIIPHIPDKKIPFMIARSFYPELIQSGIKIYEYTPGFIHAKIFVSDDRIAAVGSYNMDSRSFYLNYEVGTWLADCPAIKAISEDYEKTLQDCQAIELSDYKLFSFQSRLIGKVLRILGPLM
jgi:cardiolipin synthase